MNVDQFITRWSNRTGGAERANYALFLSELCDVLNVPRPDPASAVTEQNDYVFERLVRRTDGTTGRIDLYRRDAFVLEAKQSRQTDPSGRRGEKFVETGPDQGRLDLPTAPEPLGRRSARRGWDVLMVNARRQAEDYARDLPQHHGWPPIVLVCGVGHAIEVYADFRRMGKYEQFPDRQGFRIYLEDLRDEKIRERLRCIWLDPHGLDPTRRSAKATREIAGRLAQVSKSLEKTHAPEEVAHFLMRCLFTMFAEDVDLLPEASFQGLLQDCVASPASFAPLLDELWRTMDTGGFATSIRAAVKRFNGALFKDAKVIPLGREEIGELLAAAKANWTEVEPAIFGALLEQALEPSERKKLGAHYTPRAYVERLVTATIIEPLRADWSNVLAAVETRRAEGDAEGSVALVRTFHNRLCETRVLDPACGTGNFLYVSLDLMKRLEAEVLQTLADLGGQEALSLEGHTVDPHQFLGLELNPRAAAIAELVLWIGYLQLHFKTKGGPPGEPILCAFGNINLGKPGGYDAVLTWDGYPLPRGVREGDEVRETYPRARQPMWPEAEFIVGNPPFMGGKDLRARLNDGYAEALWTAHKGINASADFVMYWWDRAAELLTQRGTRLRRFGFVTTNSISQVFQRRVVERRLEAKAGVSLILRIPDHPWTKAAKDSAAVRIAMTVVEAGRKPGLVRETLTESKLDSDEPEVSFLDKNGIINADLTIGTTAVTSEPLLANRGIAHKGMQLNGQGFVLSKPERALLIEQDGAAITSLIRPYVNGRDLSQRNQERFALDTFGFSDVDLRSRFPHAYNRLLQTVKPERDAGREQSRKRYWWLHGRTHETQRTAIAGLSRYIGTTRTAKHRVFSFLNIRTLAESKVILIASEDAALLATLSSRMHILFSLGRGGWLGVGNDHTYNHSECFDPFPFPEPGDALKAKLGDAGEQLDAFRKNRQAEHPHLTFTQMYNVREAIRVGRVLTPEEAQIKDEGLILILNELHDEIDALACQAYGWPQALSDEEIVTRLVALNLERAAEERRGHVRWLRPDYQKARAGLASVGGEQTEADLGPLEFKSAPETFPRDPIEQSAAVAAALAQASGPISAAAITARWRKDKRNDRKIAGILAAFVRTGAAFTSDGGQTFRGRRAA